MIQYNDLSLPESVLAELSKLNIDYVFQSIYFPDGKTVYAREALMRPKDKNVLELIRDYTAQGKLHVLELATFFGATKEYFSRGYKERLCINSFPCEAFSYDELLSYVEYFGTDKEVIIIELLEFPEFVLDKALIKREHAAYSDSGIALDDFGAGFNDMEKVDLVKPDFVKLDRALLSGIDHNEEKKKNCRKTINELHSRGIKVVAEGVETKEEFDYMVSIGADLFQGYYLHIPA